LADRFLDFLVGMETELGLLYTMAILDTFLPSFFMSSRTGKNMTVVVVVGRNPDAEEILETRSSRGGGGLRAEIKGNLRAFGHETGWAWSPSYW